MKEIDMADSPQQPIPLNSPVQKDVVISVEHVSKKFCRNLRRSMAYGMVDLSKNLLGLSPKNGQLRKDEFWALDDISFELKRGETLGIVGMNGSGKSTLLRLLTGIFPPDKGEIRVNGQVGALVAVGAGFHPHMTGRENIFLNGTILGMSKREIQEKFDDIVNFSEIGDFLDAPVSTYSSGMRVRLGFSVAIHCKPDILLIDEVLSVGDVGFRNKSLQYMAEYREQANAIIFISHNLEQIRVLCSRLLILDKGEIIYSGETHEGVELYLAKHRRKILEPSTGSQKSTLVSTLGDYENNSIQVEDMGILSPEEKRIDYIHVREPLCFFSTFSISHDIKELYFILALLDEKWKSNIIRIVSNDFNKQSFRDLHPGRYLLKINILDQNLTPGKYFFHLAIRNGESSETYARIKTMEPFEIISEKPVLDGRGMIDVHEEWNLSKIDEPNP
ncbi:ABC transporter ATP-binding protein [candidate division KSB3 bacterium]|uniref:ABC transporter ATP-binding protein n=1 Tax=candidate division KSB3 bacterium TaxID=2044937 RepID=A0A2G6KHR8_9BACT|nr:MAG: ABC transporter ATP-binding protein [candidate division KSB3 bacterium]